MTVPARRQGAEQTDSGVAGNGGGGLWRLPRTGSKGENCSEAAWRTWRSRWAEMAWHHAGTSDLRCRENCTRLYRVPAPDLTVTLDFAQPKVRATSRSVRLAIHGRRRASANLPSGASTRTRVFNFTFDLQDRHPLSLPPAKTPAASPSVHGRWVPVADQAFPPCPARLDLLLRL